MQQVEALKPADHPHSILWTAVAWHCHRLINAVALERGLDTVVWQLIASVAVPGYTIHTIVALTRSLLEQSEVSLGGRRWKRGLRGARAERRVREAGHG